MTDPAGNQSVPKLTAGDGVGLSGDDFVRLAGALFDEIEGGTDDKGRDETKDRAMVM